MSREIAAALRKACDDLIHDTNKAYSEGYVKYLKGIKSRLEESGDLYKRLERDAEAKAKGVSGDTAGVKRTFDQMEHDGSGGPGLPKTGQHSGGNSSTTTGPTDPVDVVSGQLLESVTDVSLPGVLPLVLRRAYASGYEYGSGLGPGWSSTLDIRLLSGADGSVRFLGDDAQCLDYGPPDQAALRLGTRVYPRYGARWPLGASPDGREWTVEDPRTGISYQFAGTGDGDRPLLAIRDRAGNEITIHRDDDGRPVLVRHSGGYRVRVELTDTPAGQRIAGYVLEAGDVPESGGALESPGAVDEPLAGFGYDEDGRLTRVLDSAGTPHSYEYDSSNRIRAWTDRSGYRYPYRYDDAGRVVETGEPGGFKHSRLSYQPGERLSRVTDATGNTTTYRYDLHRQVTSITDPHGARTRFRKDPSGRLLSHTTPAGHETTFQYDEHGNQTRVNFPDGRSLVLAYEGPGQLSRVEFPDGGVWRYTRDDRGNVLTETDPQGAVTSFTYDDRGAITSVTDPLETVQRFENNAAGLPVAAIDPFGGRTEITRDQHGRVIALRTPEGAVSTLRRDSEGRIVAQAGADGAVRQVEYDAAGNRVATIEPSGLRTSYEYGPFYLPVARVEPDGSRYAFAYDPELRLTMVTGPTGLTWTYKYDGNGNRTFERDFDGLEQSFEFDEDGLLTARTSPDGEVTEYKRDVAGRLVELRAGTDVSRFGYDPVGRLVRAENEHATVVITRDLLGRPVREEANGAAVTRSYDASGNLTARVTPSGARSRWDYDDGGDVQSLAVGPRTLSFTRDSVGREILRQTGEISLAQEYDQSGQLIGQRVTASGRTLQERSYGYDADGIPNRITDLLRGTRRLELDRAGRITGVLPVDGPDAGIGSHASVGVGTGRAERYAYDPIGNLVSAGRVTVSKTDRYVTKGTRIMQSGRTTYRYDARGRLAEKTLRTLSGQRRTWTYTWNSGDRLTCVTRPDGQSWAYKYDALGRRIEKSRRTREGTTADVTSFTWDGTVLAEQVADRADGASDVLTWDYEPDGYSPAVQRRSSRSARSETDERFWAIVTDLAGTPQELVSGEGTIDWTRRTSLWGRPLDPAGAADDAGTGDSALCPIGFPGQYHDPETGLAYNNQRYYDPDTGYYLSPDPQGLDAAPHPQRYVSNPLVLADPLGLAPSGPASALKTDDELQADADLLHATFGVNAKTKHGLSGNTVAVHQAPDGGLSYSVSGSRTNPHMRNLADALGYRRKAGQEFKGPNQTDAEQLLMNGIRDKKIPDGGRLASSRVPCEEKRPTLRNGQEVAAQRCTHRLSDFTKNGNVKVVGRYAEHMKNWMSKNPNMGYD